MRLYESTINKSFLRGGNKWDILMKVGKFLLPMIQKVGIGAAEGLAKKVSKAIGGEGLKKRMIM